MTINTDQPTAAVAITAEIVMTYISRNVLPAHELPALIADTHAAIVALSAPAVEPAPLEPPVPIRKTITPDHIISLEDGKPYKSLRRHLTSRGMTFEEYKAKWGLPAGYPAVAPSYAAKRSELAKSSGLGQIRRNRRLAAVA